MQGQPSTKRSLQACLRCRQQKMKCSGGPSPCERCIKFNRGCVFEPTQHPSPSIIRRSRESAYVSILPALTPDRGSEFGLHRSPTRSHVDNSQSSSFQFQGCALQTLDTPYSSVQNLESQYSTSTSLTMRLSHCSQQIQAKDQPECYISEVGIPLSDAEQMFMLFGERLAVFIPSLYETDFSRLPSNPILGLAALHAITRYLPDSTGLRSRLADRLYKLLENIIFHSLIRWNGADADTLQGPIVLYACCDTGPVFDSARGQDGFDMLTVKSIVEGYAVSMKIGIPCHENSPNILSYVFWLWLYTMSHHSAIIHGCERTMWAWVAVHRAKAFVEQNVFHPRIKGLLGEVDLCMLWERVWAKPSRTKRIVDLELNTWRVKWNAFIAKATAEGRHLIFHFLFTSLELHKNITRSSNTSALETSHDVDAAQAFLRFISGLPVVSKDRLRYMSDFGFVMLAYACEFILKTIQASSMSEDRKYSLLQEVAEIASLMQSFSAQKEMRPAVYGHAIAELCRNITSIFANMANSSSMDLVDLANICNPERSMPLLDTNLSESLIGTDAICIPDDLQVSPGEKNADEYWFQTLAALWDYGMGTNPAVASAVPS